ncbi:MAG: NusG domain II-containing protein [Candidatus Wallbacteria bacterium]|nr:NusG domain II-containing protein [Candidatus Wallbacteria bacterium]
MRRKFFKTNDLLLPILVILLALSGSGKKGDRVEIQNGVSLLSYSLSAERLIEISGKFPLKIRISEGQVSVYGSLCQNHICEKMGKISAPGECIVCVPARIIIRIKGDSGELDAICQ